MGITIKTREQEGACSFDFLVQELSYMFYSKDQMLLLGYHMLGLGLVAASVRGVKQVTRNNKTKS